MVSVKRISERQLLVICSILVIFLITFTVTSGKAEALRLIVRDEDESVRNSDFLMTDADMNVLENQSDLRKVLKEATNQAGNNSDINYMDLKNVKFFYADNGTIVADIVFNNNTNYKFNEGTTYGMAININAFPNATKPELTDADYIYKYVYNKGAWYNILGIEHSGGEERYFSPNKIDSNGLNKTQNYVRMKFDTNRIGKPDSFQVQFFGWTRVPLSNQSYSLIDVIPWIEVPEQEISLSLDRAINKVYPDDSKSLNVIIKSTSELSKTIKLCQDELCNPVECINYCWNFTKINGTVHDSVALSPPTNLRYLPVTLVTKNIGSGKLHTQLYANISPADKKTATSKPDKEPMVWDFDVGNKWRDRWDYIINLPSHIFTLGVTIITAIVTFLGGLLIDRKSLTLKLKNLFKKEKESPPGSGVG